MGEYARSAEKEILSKEKSSYHFQMNSIVIKTKMESLRKCLDRIESKKPETLENLLQDIDTQDIIALNLERSVQLCVDIANHI